MKILSKFCLAVLVLAAFAPQARADYFVWRDAKTGLSLTFPDTWRVVSNAQPDDILTVMAPGGRADAVCRVRADADRRFMIYPPKYGADVQRTAVSGDFWNGYVARYDNGRIAAVHDGAGLGRGFASYAEAAYDGAMMDSTMPRRALMFASLYNGTLYVVECSAHRDAFAEWRHAFLGVAGSVDFKPSYGTTTQGYYHELGGPDIEFRDSHWKSTELY